ncbi:MAG: RNA chaperone Hfq [Gammaproteobacteria bacterium]|nr:MAG: RNA chaperone Hfq [Gammaproteobacteria bacterium]RTZ69369.1 MAG: RNA chaperone Hfq [Aquificaceae bacterium]
MEQNNQAILQDQLLSKAMEENKPVTVYLTRGNRITGYVKSFDRFCILLEVNGEEQLIFKHAVSTVVPQR